MIHKIHDDTPYRAIILAIIAMVLAIFFLIPSLCHATTMNATPATFDSLLAIASPGDSLVLGDGYYDTHTFTSIAGEVDSPIYIIAENAGLAKFDYLVFSGSDYMYLSGIAVTPYASGSYVIPSINDTIGGDYAVYSNARNLVTVADSSSHIYFKSCTIQATTAAWSVAQAWTDSSFYAGIYSDTSTDSISIDGCTIRDGHYLVSMYGDSTLITGCTIERFSEDGVRFGSYTTVRGNTIQDSYSPFANPHNDLIQFGFGGVTVVGVTIEDNIMLAMSPGRDRNVFEPYIQGIFSDQGCTDVVIQNNVIVPHYSGLGIGIYDILRGTIVHNTVAIMDSVTDAFYDEHEAELGYSKVHGTIQIDDAGYNAIQSDSVFVGYNIATGFTNGADGDSVIFWSNYSFGNVNAWDKNYAAQYAVFRNLDDADFYPADSTVAIVDPSDSTGFTQATFPADDIVSATRDATPDIGAYEYTGGGGGVPAGDPRTWIHPTDLADQTAINDSLGNDDTLLLLRDGVTLTTLSVPNDSIDIGVSGSSGYATLSGRTQATNWSVLTGGTVADTMTVKPAATGDDVYNQYVGEVDDYYTSFSIGRTVGKIAGGDYPFRAAYTFTGDDLTGATVTGASLTLTVADGTTGSATYAGHNFIIHGQISAVGAITNGTSFRAAFADSSVAHRDTAFADDGTPPNMFVIDNLTSVIQEVIDDSDYADGKIRLLMGTFTNNSTPLLPLDYADTTRGSNTDLLATLIVYYSTTGTSDDHLRYKAIATQPAFVTIGGTRQTVVTDTSLVSASGDTVAYFDGKLWVTPSDTATVYYSDATGIDLNSHTTTTITGDGSLLLKWHNAAFTEDSTLTVSRVIADSIGRFGNTYKRTITRATIGKVDSIGAGTYTNCLFLTEIDSTKISGEAVFNYCLFDNWAYTPSGDSNSSADFTITGYTPADNQVYADNGIPFGAIEYVEYTAPEGTTETARVMLRNGIPQYILRYGVPQYILKP